MGGAQKVPYGELADIALIRGYFPQMKRGSFCANIV
jgi:hypothetical protein